MNDVYNHTLGCLNLFGFYFQLTPKNMLNDNKKFTYREILNKDYLPYKLLNNFIIKINGGLPGIRTQNFCSEDKCDDPFHQETN